MAWWLLVLFALVLMLSGTKGAGSAAKPGGSGSHGPKGRGPHGATLEQTVDRNLPSSAQGKGDSGDAFAKLTQEYKGPREVARKYSPSEGGSGAAARNVVRNMPTNLVDNTVGYFIAKYQNMKSRRELAQNPNRPIEYLMHGEVQNQGSQWRLARDSRKRGFVPYHLAGRHSLQRKLSTEQKVDNAYEQIQQLHNSVGIKNAYSRNDVFSGHSTGGNRAIDMAKDKRTIQYGIKTYQARAPNPVSTEPRTIWQKLLMTFLPGDSAKTPQGRARAVELAGKGTPLVPVHVVAGEYDRLVPPEDTVYKKAASHTIIRGPDSTHFGTSGGNRSINAQMLNHLYAAMNTSGHEYTPGASYKPLRAA